MSGNAMPNSVQQPIFGPAHGSALGDDIDLNEIFADYFISEFDDPLNAYTSSMANYSGAAAAVALAQKQQQVDAAAAAAAATTTVAEPAPHPTVQQVSLPGAPAPAVVAVAVAAPSASSALPTGGIKTAFHSGVQQQQQQQQGNGGTVGEPVTKKLRESAPVVVVPTGGVPVYTQAPVGPATAAAGLAPVTNAPIGKGAISGRLGFTVVGGEIKQTQPQNVSRQPAATTGIALPVGVGIRLGGVGGVAPATAQFGVRGPNPAWGMNSAGALSDKAVAERRQRNREHAKRSRVRKKFMLESLQGQVRELQKENLELRMLIQEKIPQHAQQIISECCGKNSLFADPDVDMSDVDPTGEKKKETALVKSDFSLIESLTSGQQNFVLSDPRLPDNPIVYASPGFYELTGYTQDQVLGRNCRFLQGPGTDPRAVDIIRKAIANGSDSTSCILNYKADGTPFWNQFFVAALRDSDNCIVNYVGVQCEVEPEAGSTALEDKVNSVLPLQHKEGEETA